MCEGHKLDVNVIWAMFKIYIHSKVTKMVKYLINSQKTPKMTKNTKNGQKRQKTPKNTKNHEKCKNVKFGGAPRGPPGPRKKKRH